VTLDELCPLERISHKPGRPTPIYRCGECGLEILEPAAHVERSHPDITVDAP